MNDTVRAIAFSIIVHALALGVLVIGFDTKPMPLKSGASKAEAVEAVAIDESRVQEELRRLKNTEHSRRSEEEERRRRLEEEAELARLAKEEEARSLAELKTQREQEQREAEQQRQQIAMLKLEQERIQKEKAELEKKRTEEQQRLAETAKQRKAEEARLENEKQLRAKLAVEEKQLRERQAAEEKQERKQRLSKLVQQYELDIRDQVRRNWLRPAGSTEDFTCKVFVRQLPGGDVVSVQVTKSCGNPALDRSVEAAVRKASPLPAPPDPELFDKEIDFTFKPR